MKAQIRYEEQRLAVTELLLPYKNKPKGGTLRIAIYSDAIKRWIIRIPKALQTCGQDKIYAETERDVYRKAYALLIGEHRPTMREIYELVMEDRRADRCITSETVKRDERFWRKWYDRAPIVDRPIESIKTSELIAFLRNACGDCEVTRNTYTNIKSLMNLIYDYAATHDIIAINKARQLGRTGIKFKPQDRPTYTDEEREKVLSYIEDNALWDRSPYYAAIYLMFHFCARIGEIKALRWTDYDEATRTMQIVREVVTRDGDQIEVDHTKSSEYGNRPQHVPAKVAAMLSRLKQDRRSLLICPSQTGQYLDTDRFNRKLKVICNRVGIPYKSSHKIRFWTVSAMARASGGDIAVVGQYAGQHNQQTTLGYVRGIQNTDTQRAAARRAFGD